LVIKDLHPRTKATTWLEARCGGYLLKAIRFQYRAGNDAGFEEIGRDPALWRIHVEFQSADLVVTTFNTLLAEKLRGENVSILVWSKFLDLHPISLENTSTRETEA
jgi:hypothetical protein